MSARLGGGGAAGAGEDDEFTDEIEVDFDDEPDGGRGDDGEPTSPSVVRKVAGFEDESF